MLTPTATVRRERSLNENDKEQSGAETVKIASRIQDPCPRFKLLVTARWRYFK